jgi:hypothetical protein
VHRHNMKFAVVIKRKNAEISFAKTRTMRQNGLKYRIELAGRTRYDAQYFRSRGLLLQRFRKFLRALFNRALEVGIGFLQAAGQVVELVGERLDLVAGLDGDALA